MPILDIPASTEIRAPRGSILRCKGWKQEAALRMLMNNLDPEVAERPQDLVVYGGSGKAARDWPSYHAIVRELEALGDDETLLVQSGKPVGEASYRTATAAAASRWHRPLSDTPPGECLTPAGAPVIAIPGGAQDVAAKSQVPAVGREDFERNRPVIATGLKHLHRCIHIHAAGSERKMQIRVAAAIVVQVDMPQPRTIGCENFACRAVWHAEIGVSEVQMQAQIW